MEKKRERNLLAGNLSTLQCTIALLQKQRTITHITAGCIIIVMRSVIRFICAFRVRTRVARPAHRQFRVRVRNVNKHVHVTNVWKMLVKSRGVNIREILGRHQHFVHSRNFKGTVHFGEQK